MPDSRNILVLGASGLIGHFIADDLRARRLAVIGVARQFGPSGMPDLWIEPLGPLLKTLPIMVLILVAIAISEDR